MTHLMSLAGRVWRAVALGACVVLAMAGAAGAVLPPGAYEEARRTAEHHVQVELDRVKGPGVFTRFGACFAKGEVVTVFRGSLSVGDRAWFPVDCVKANAEPPPGPQLWVAMRALRAAPFVEVYLNSDADGDLRVATWQIALLNAASPEPACSPDKPGFC